MRMFLLNHSVFSMASQKGWKRKACCGTSLAVQWLRLCTSTAGGAGSIPGRGSPACCSAAKKEERRKEGREGGRKGGRKEGRKEGRKKGKEREGKEGREKEKRVVLLVRAQRHGGRIRNPVRGLDCSNITQILLARSLHPSD